MHVVDITHPDAAEQAEAVERTLVELEVAGKPRITLLNKVDRLTRSDGSPLRGLEDLEEYELSLSVHRPDAYFVSALLGWGLHEVLACVEGALFGEETTTAARKGAAAGR